jgi:hypothetical protein
MANALFRPTVNVLVDGVSIWGANPTTMSSFWTAAGVTPLVAVNVTVREPSARGPAVPEMVSVLALNCKPCGSGPDSLIVGVGVPTAVT